ncbi:MAG TPA: hypothetical protein VF645_06050 [Allosphingosinicella sp.]|jgi:hypothetical protein
MEKKTFAFKLSDKAARGASKWTARDGISLAGCSNVGDYNYRASRLRGDDGIYC